MLNVTNLVSNTYYTIARRKSINPFYFGEVSHVARDNNCGFFGGNSEILFFILVFLILFGGFFD